MVWREKCNFLRIAACGMQECSLLVFEGQASNFILVTVNGEYKCRSQLFGLSLYYFLKSSTKPLVSDEMRYWNIYISMIWEMCGIFDSKQRESRQPSLLPVLPFVSQTYISFR